MKIAANLKTVPRQGWIDKLSIEKPESVADHTYSMAIIGMILSDSKNYNTEKFLKMILLHDLSESIIGDITPEQKPREEKTILENKTFKKIISNLPENLQNQYNELWNEFQKNESLEAKLVHQIDKFEMALQAKIYSDKNFSSKDIIPFFDTAKKEINDPKLLEWFNQLSKK